MCSSEKKVDITHILLIIYLELNLVYRFVFDGISNINYLVSYP